MNTPVIVQAPPSKSLSHRVLMAAALAAGESQLSHVLESDDTSRTRELLVGLGAQFTRTGPGAFLVRGIAGAVSATATGQPQPLSCFVGESGTTCRLVTAILAAGQGHFRLHGAGRMHERPMAELLNALALLGARFHAEGREGHLPGVLEASGFDPSALPDGMLDMGSDESSQYLSGLLLAAPLSPAGLTVRLAGKKAVSWPYIGLTLDTLERFGISFTVEALVGTAVEASVEAAGESPRKSPGESSGATVQGAPSAWQATNWRALSEAVPGKLRFRIQPGQYQAGTHAVEGDWSGASYFLAAGAIGPRPVCVEGLHADSLQGDAAIMEILEAMGARIERGPGRVTAFPAALRGITVDMGHCPDLVPTVAAVAAHATGVTCIENVAHLKIKESDRLAAPAAELAKVGCMVEVTTSGLVITPPAGGPQTPAPGTIFHAHDDHRIAMGMSLLGLPGLASLSGAGGGSGFAVPLDNPSCVAKSFPNFWDVWNQVRP